jgi:hypothetical protein
LSYGGLLFGLVALPAHAQVLEWVRQPGGTIAEPEYSQGVSADGLGNVYIVGSGGTIGNNQIYVLGYSEAFLIKFNAAAQHQWMRQLASAQGVAAIGVSADGLGNAYISGRLGGWLGANEDAFLSKYDAAGALQWTRQFGTDGDDGNWDISADALGNVYVVGDTSGDLNDPSLPPRLNDRDAFIRKYDAAGELQWTRQFGAQQQDGGYGVSTDAMGNAFMVGFTRYGGGYLKKYDAAGNLEWTQQDDALSNGVGRWGVSADALGNIFVSGRISAGGNNYNGLISKFDTGGERQWTKQFHSGNYFNFADVSADGLGNVYVSSEVSAGVGSRDVYVTKYSADGEPQWTRLLETSQIDFNSGVAADGLGNVYVSGSVRIRPIQLGAPGGPDDPGDSDPFLAKFNDCEDCVPPPIPPIVTDIDLGGEIFPGSLVSHQFTTSFGDLPVIWSNLVSTRPTVNAPTLSDSGLFSWQTSRLDAPGTYYFDVTATNDGGSDSGRLTVRLAIIPEPTAMLLASVGICMSTFLLRGRD